MAKPAKKKVAGKKKSNLPPVEKPEFGVEALSKELGVEDATTRLKLREAGIKKDGKTYDFKNAAGVKAMAKKLGGAKSEA